MKPLTKKQLAVFRTHSDGKWFPLGRTPYSLNTLLSLVERGLLESDAAYRFRVPKALIEVAHQIYSGENWSPDGIEILREES